MSLLDEFGRPIASDDPWSVMEREINETMRAMRDKIEREWFGAPSGAVLDADGNVLPESEPRNDLERARRKRGVR